MPRDMRYPHKDAHTNLINISNSPHNEMDVYIGDETDSDGLDKSPFSNPFDKADYGREEAIEHYRLYLYRRYIQDDEFRKSLHSIEGKTLGCWCYPDKCHGEVIVDLLNKHHKDGIEDTIQYMNDQIEDINTDNLGADGFKELEATREAISSIKSEING